jgi:hypothetical protein
MHWKKSFLGLAVESRLVVGRPLSASQEVQGPWWLAEELM